MQQHFAFSYHCDPEWRSRPPKQVSSSSSSAFPAIPVGFTILGEILHMWQVFNPTIEVVIFHPRGWSMLGVFLLTAFIRLGIYVWIFGVRAMECICAQTRPQFILSFKRVFGEWSQNQGKNSKGKIPYRGGSEEDRTCDAVSRRTANPTHYWLNYSAPSTGTKM